MRELLLNAFKDYAEGNIQKHRANVEVYLANPVGIGEHSDILEAIESEVKHIAEFDDMLEVLDKYFDTK
jgi:hypothetical protein